MMLTKLIFGIAALCPLVLHAHSNPEGTDVERAGMRSLLQTEHKILVNNTGSEQVCAKARELSEISNAVLELGAVDGTCVGCSIVALRTQDLVGNCGTCVNGVGTCRSQINSLIREIHSSLLLIENGDDGLKI